MTPTTEARLLAAVREAKAALEPFAAVGADYDEGTIGDRFPGSEVMYGYDKPDLGDFRRARTALARLGELGDHADPS